MDTTLTDGRFVDRWLEEHREKIDLARVVSQQFVAKTDEILKLEAQDRVTGTWKAFRGTWQSLANSLGAFELHGWLEHYKPRRHVQRVPRTFDGEPQRPDSELYNLYAWRSENTGALRGSCEAALDVVASIDALRRSRPERREVAIERLAGKIEDLKYHLSRINEGFRQPDDWY